MTTCLSVEDHQERKRSKMGRIKKLNTSLENYLDFITDRDHLLLSINFLNKMIYMHGFKRILKAPKDVLVDALNTIDLIDPSRSTLKENLNPCEFMAIEEVVADLKDLNWQECCVTSVQTVNACRESIISAPSPPAQISSRQCTNDDLSEPIIGLKKINEVLKRRNVSHSDGSNDARSGGEGRGKKKKKGSIKPPGVFENHVSPLSTALVWNESSC